MFEILGSIEALLMPWERVQTLLLQEYKGEKFPTTPRCVKKLCTTYGIKELYRGFTPILLRNGPSSALFFGIKSMEDQLKSIEDQLPSFLNFSMLKGAGLGCTIGFITYPLNVAKIHMQRMEKVGKEFQSMSAALNEVYIQRGRKWYKLFRGAGMNSIRASLFWGITNFCYESKFFQNPLKVSLSLMETSNHASSQSREEINLEKFEKK